MDPSREVNGGPAVEIEGAARKSESRAADHIRRKDVCFVQAHYLLSECHVDEAERVIRRRVGIAVVSRVYAGQGVLSRERLIDASCSEILSDLLNRIAESLGNSAWRSVRVQELRAVRDRPQRE